MSFASFVQFLGVHTSIAGSLSDDGSIDLMFNNISREREDWDSFLKDLKEARKNRYPILLFLNRVILNGASIACIFVIQQMSDSNSTRPKSINSKVT